MWSCSVVNSVLITDTTWLEILSSSQPTEKSQGIYIFVATAVVKLDLKGDFPSIENSEEIQYTY